MKKITFKERIKLVLTILTLTFSSFLFAQNGIIGSGFTNGWGIGDIISFDTGAGSSRIKILNPRGTGNQFFRLVRNWDGDLNQFGPFGCVDFDWTNPGVIYGASTCNTSGAFFINCPNTTDNYVFKTPNGNTTMDLLYFRIEGAVRSVSSVTQSPAAAAVAPNMPVTVTATLNGALSTGQAVYLRSSTDNFVTSTVTQMTGSGTSYSAQIPGASASAVVRYYVFTSGTNNVAANGSNADLYTINANTNGGTNYSYTVAAATNVVTVTSSGGTGAAGVLYATLGAAFNAINAGTAHTGAIIISINGNTTETAPCVLNSSGAGSASYTSVLIQPTADNLTISGATATGRGLIELNGADNVTINGDNPNTSGTNRNLTITNSAVNTVTHTSVVRLATSSLITSCDNNQIRNCILNGSATGRNTSTMTSSSGTEWLSWGILAGGGANTTSATNAPSAITSTSTTSGSGQTFLNLVIDNNSVQTCARAINVLGSATTVAPILTITNNLVGNAAAGNSNQVYAIGISAQGFSTGTVISGNIVYVENFVGTSGTHGITVGNVSASGTNAIIERNQVLRCLGKSTGGWGVRGIDLSAGNNITLRNNYVTNVNNGSSFSFGPTAGAFGIRIAAGTGHLVYHNSVNISGVNPGTGSGLVAALGVTGTGLTGCNIRNNILSNTATGSGASSAHVCLYLPSGGTSSMNLTLNNNAYYTGSTSGLHGVLQVGTPYSSANLYTAANFSAAATTPSTNSRSYTSILSTAGSNDNASFAATTAAPFTSSSNLKINTSASGVSVLFRTGAVGTGVTTDIENESRATNPCMGADEFVLPVSCTTPTTPTNVSTNVSQTTSLTWAAATNATSYDVFLGTNNPPTNVVNGTNVTSTSFTPASALNPSTTYFWQIVPKNAGSTASGCTVWSFTTQAAVPTLSTVQPSLSFGNLCVNSNTNSTFTMNAVNLTGSSVTITAPSGYTVSEDNVTFASSITVNHTSGAFTSKTIHVRFSPVAVASYSGNVVISGGELSTDVNVSVSGAGTGLSGTYTVGSGGNYTTLTAAVAAYNSTCLFGPVVFNLTDATYSTSETFPITINANTSASATNTLTIKPASVVNATITGSVNSSGLIRLNGADWVILDGSNNGTTTRNLTVTNTSTTAPVGILVSSVGIGAGSTNNLIENINITTGAGSTAYGISMGGNSGGSTGADNDNNIIFNNHITTGVTVGIYAGGTASTSSGANDNLSINGNAITLNVTGTTVYGIQISNSISSTVSDNTIDVQTSGAGQPVGISIETGVTSSSVLRNNISRVLVTNTGGYGGRGITIGTGNASSSLTIANNMISGVNGSNWTGFTNSSSMGIAIGVAGNSTSFGTTTGGVNLYYNTVNLTGNYIGTSTTAAKLTTALFVGTSTSALDIRNNIFVNALNNTTATAKNYAIYSAITNTAFSNLNYNNYFVSGSQGVLGFLTSDRTDLAGIISGFGGNANSMNINPPFVSATDLHINSGSTQTQLESGGIVISGLTTDIDGQTRPGPAGSVNGGGTAPDIGADEFDGVPSRCSVTPSGVTASVTSSTTATISWSAASPAPVSGYEYFVSTSTTAPTASTSASGTTAAGVTTANLTGLTANTTYYFWVRSNCGGTDGTSSWVSGGTFTTPCSAANVPYLQNFESVAAGSIPSCTQVVQGGTGNLWTTVSNPFPGFFTSMTLRYSFNATNPANTWYFIQGLNLTAGVTYRLSYRYGSAYSSTNTFPENLKVAYGTSNTIVAMTNTLADHPNITINNQTNTVDFTPSSTGIYYIGFQAYSLVDEDRLFLDDISVTLAPDPITITPSSSTTFCNGNSVQLTASSSATYTYTWSPSSGLNTTTGATVTANPSTTTTYTVTGNNGAGMIGTQSITVTVNSAPTDITIQSTINGVDACNQNYVELAINNNNAVSVFKEGFETNTTTTFAFATNGSAGVYIEPYYTEGSSSRSLVGSGDFDLRSGNTEMTLANNTINLSQYASATLTFDHICASEATYDFGYVQYSLDAGTNWIDFPTTSYSGSGTLKNGVVSFDKSSYSDWNTQFTSSTSTPGIAPATALFKSESINLNAFMTNTNFRIRFRLNYDDSNDYYGWIIDNVKINIVPKVTWSPITNLYTDTALTTAYTTGTNATTVYALPNGVQNYTATATIGSCSKTDTETVTNNTKRYVGTNGGNWDVINSWLPTGIPTLDNCVKIPTGKSVIVSGSTAIANTLTIESNTATITVSGDGVLKLNNTLTNLGTGTNVTFENNSSLIQINDVANTGNISYNRTSPQTVLNTDYVYWSSPVSGQTVPSTGLNYFWSNAAGTTGNWVSASGQALTAGKGVIMRGIASRNFTGVPFNGEINVDVFRRNLVGYNDNWNLIGNPYPSAISADDFLADSDNAAIEGSIAIWTHGTAISSNNSSPFYGNFAYNYSPSDYIIYNLSGSQTGPNTYNGFIPAGQGFFIKYENDDIASPANATSTIKFKNSMRSDADGNAYSNTQFFRNSGNVSQNLEKSRIWIDIINSSSASYRTVVGYIESATDGKDRLFDATTNVKSSTTSVYSLIGNDKMCIQGKGLPFNNSDIIPLGFNAAQAGNLTIAIHALDGLFVNQEVYLLDTQLNITHNIKLTPYTFTAAQGENNTRFRLIFNNGTLSNPEFDADRSLIIVNKHKLEVISNVEQIEAITVFDLLGRNIYMNKNINSKEFVIPISQERAPLIVKIKLANGINVERKTLY